MRLGKQLITSLYIRVAGGEGRRSISSHCYGNDSRAGTLVPSVKRYHPIAADLAIPEIAQGMTFTEPVVTGDANNRIKV